MGMALCSLVRLSQISGAPSHRRSTWCRHQPADGKAHLAYILCVSAVQTTVAVKGLHLQGWVHAKPIEMQRFEQFTALIIINFHITT
ncbi:hypothetical protein PVAP13_3KG246500 [Panicum virgatum]|uniref:Uncharacterized protein n=1 Tax=Panicum virgatum TaxID=38727 RepID=A0A8T0V1Z8_PANVG|nr:hypothetical protein PVAP13_3KG246500 [Panicum virgatum]KAG2628405.1 hypothetical protein PVAP13_3KG246500 [Panicum virgatum]KAG2628408.1 hypothetical protein PVAP13_3KG246500 [Panicum virgatum]